MREKKREGSRSVVGMQKAPVYVACLCDQLFSPKYIRNIGNGMEHLQRERFQQRKAPLFLLFPEGGSSVLVAELSKRAIDNNRIPRKSPSRNFQPGFWPASPFYEFVCITIPYLIGKQITVSHACRDS